MVSVDTERGDIEVGVDREYLRCRIDGLIADINKESSGIFHHMGVGQDQALLWDEHSAAEREGIGVIVKTHNENGRGFRPAIELALGKRKRHVGSWDEQQEWNQERRWG